MTIRTTRQLAVALGLGAPQDPIDVTILLPAYNEAENVERSYAEIVGVMDPTGWDYEILFVDDGSSDGTWRAIKSLAARDGRVRGLRHRINRGKAAALANGFAYSRGNIVATCDADLQYDPNDIVRMIDAVLEGNDAVSANKVVRRDPLSKRLPSKFFNAFVRATTGVKLHDMNAGLKAYRRDAAQELVRFGYGELHRFFIVILAKKGYCVTEVSVESRPRVSGKSKYGMERYLRGAMDFLTVFFLSGYMERPLHLFGGLGVAWMGIGTLIMGYLAIADLAFKQHLLASPFLQLSMLFIVSGLQLFVVGLIAEMINYLDRGTISRAGVAEVIGVERRTRAVPEGGLTIERRRDIQERAPLGSRMAPHGQSQEPEAEPNAAVRTLEGAGEQEEG